MDQITLSSLINAGIIFMGLVGFYEVVIKVVDRITKRHDREKSWDDTRKELTERYDGRLTKIDREIKGLKEEQRLTMKGLLAILEGLGQLKCNGPVTEMKDELYSFLNDKAHEEDD